MADREHPFSWQALGRIVTVGVAVYLAWQAIDVFVMILISLIFATAIFPLVRWFSRYMSLVAAAIVVLIILVIPFALFGYFLLPNLIREIPDLLKNFYGIIREARFVPQAVKNFDIVQYLTQHTSYLFDYTRLVLSVFVETITIFFLMFYLVIDHERLLAIFLDFFPRSERKKITGLLEEVALVNGRYIRGNVIISIICTVFIFVGLVALHVPFALPLAIFAGVLDLLPLVGSTLGAIPAVIFGFAISPSTGILVILLHLIYQQLENVVISPAIYNKALNISPALSFLAVVIGGGLFGILGAFLALPIAASVPAMLRYLRDYSERNA
jgi:predicted PurR-regulated permease PerM